MKRKKAWLYKVDEKFEVIIPDGTNHPAEIMFINWAGDLPRVRIQLLTSN